MSREHGDLELRQLEVVLQGEAELGDARDLRAVVGREQGRLVVVARERDSVGESF
ncbi:hypothetical protein [Nocardioides sp. B-3]|uniref:hypothetical protein n=1 Tax=Nocardioides sp. B-3 TaxID=2895565 RepID=UPI0021526229|nr:hypothetical protein [Nocardioides sp. B-3]UUZ58590.1 hypothetical protein LP418_20895 [Nocardioides sp. B-3]